MQEEFEGNLHTLLVEVQGSDLEEVETFALGKEWLGTSAMWTTERPVLTNARGIPNCVVLDAAGRVALMGHPLALHSDIEELIKQSARSRRSTPADLPRQLKGAWRELQKGAFADAIDDCEGTIGRARDEAVAEYARKLIEDARGRAERAAQRVAAMVEEGYFLEAQEFAEDLEDRLDGDGLAQLHEQVAQWVERLDGDEFAAEIDAQKALLKLERRLHVKGPDKATGHRLAKLAEDHAGTKAAERAARYARACTEE